MAGGSLGAWRRRAEGEPGHPPCPAAGRGGTRPAHRAHRGVAAETGITSPGPPPTPTDHRRPTRYFWAASAPAISLNASLYFRIFRTYAAVSIPIVSVVTSSTLLNHWFGSSPRFTASLRMPEILSGPAL